VHKLSISTLTSLIEKLYTLQSPDLINNVFKQHPHPCRSRL